MDLLLRCGGVWGVSMLLLDLVSPDEVESSSGPSEETVKSLCERSLQLQEYARLLRERSLELNRRIQSYLNSKRVM
jgi:hypothetical protein